MSATSELVRLLIEKRNGDGGWPYRQGTTWTEPTAFALLAFEAAGYDGREVDEGREWLRRTQNKDGGWAAAPLTGESSWVTSLALLAIRDDDLASESGRNGLRWIVAQRSAEPNSLLRIYQWFAGNSERLNREGGAPWVARTSSWVIPTCVTVLALRRALRLMPEPDYRRRFDAARAFLIERRLPDGGWNHGGFFAHNEQVASYPETTGLALLALRELPDGIMESTLCKAESMAKEARSAEAHSWLRLGLAAQGRGNPPASNLPFRCWTTVDSALYLLAQTTDQRTNPFTGDLVA
jgi:hypothetical protein